MTSTAALVEPVSLRPALKPGAAAASDGRFPVLDGWRGISILLVLGCHLLPLGPKGTWNFNEAFGAAGMSLFFTLSGFLITLSLYSHHDITSFFVRRAVRILPTFLVFLAVMTLLIPAMRWKGLFNYLTFENNYNFSWAIAHPQSHYLSQLWSVCVEVHFYIFIGLLMLATRFRGFWLLPFLAVAVTGYRIYTHTYININTLTRVDEILAGTLLALVYFTPAAESLRRFLGRVPIIIPLVLLFISCDPRSGALQYARPYFGAFTVGTSLFAVSQPRWTRFLSTRTLAYLATISYALYVWHKIGLMGWMGEGDGMVKYAKRPLVLATAFAIAHVSTFYIEQPCITAAKRFLKRRDARKTARVAEPISGVATLAGTPEPVAVLPESVVSSSTQADETHPTFIDG